MPKPYPIYNEDKPPQPGMYLGVFHGRKTDAEALQDWGANGPIIGPINWCHSTYYSHVRIQFADGVDFKKYGFDNDEPDIPVSAGGCLQIDGMLYGDWTVFHHRMPESDPARKADLAAAIAKARLTLDGDSNDAEHDALFELLTLLD
jgi:hypothetical protein